MKKLLFIPFLLSCKAPDKIEHSGKIETVNIIRIEIAMPPSLVEAFNTTCENKCKDDQDPKCSEVCKAEQETNYTNQILLLIAQFQATTTSTTIPPL